MRAAYQIALERIELIKLYQFPPAWGLPNGSPFCLKLETYLRMSGLRYEVYNGMYLARAPKGKLPFIEHGQQRIGDTELIIDYLREHFGDPLDAELSPAQRATSTAFRCLIEEHLYWVGMYARWFEQENWPQVKSEFFRGLPPLLRQLVPPLARRNMRRELWGQGMGRHCPEDIYVLGIRDLNALSAQLGDQPYLLGDQPHAIDASMYAFLTNILVPPLDSILRRHLQSQINLVAYCYRMERRYFPELLAAEATVGPKQPLRAAEA